MKTLYIVRHAKSSWKYPELSDDERPLLQKGIKRTLKISSYLKQKGIHPDVMISSHAVRAYDTACIIAEDLDFPREKIRVSGNLYFTSTDKLFDELFSLDDTVESVIVFGHNPTFTSFANHFLDEKIDWLPTSAVVSVSFDTRQWENIPLAKRTTNFIVTPKEL